MVLLLAAFGCSNIALQFDTAGQGPGEARVPHRAFSHLHLSHCSPVEILPACVLASCLCAPNYFSSLHFWLLNEDNFSYLIRECQSGG